MEEANKIVQQVTDLLRELAHQLGVTVGQVFDILTWQARFEGIIGSCDVKLCVNPAHLKLGTHGDNMRDMAAKGRQWMQQRQRWEAAGLSEGLLYALC